MGFTEEIRSQLFGMGALGRRRAINELRSSEDKYARSLVPCLEDVVARPRSKRGLSKEQICIMSGVLARLLSLLLLRSLTDL